MQEAEVPVVGTAWGGWGRGVCLSEGGRACDKTWGWRHLNLGEGWCWNLRSGATALRLLQPPESRISETGRGSAPPGPTSGVCTGKGAAKLRPGRAERRCPAGEGLRQGGGQREAATGAVPGALGGAPARLTMARRPRHSIYSSDEDDEDIEMCDHDYDGLLPKSGKRHLGKTRWTREEDEKLKKLVEQNGTDDWKVIANYLPNRTDVQCQHRWQKVLNPELIKGPWTKEEDQRRHYNDEDPEKEKRIKELELLLMSTENELKGQQPLPTQNHTCSYPGWHSTSIVDQTRPHGDSAPVSCLGEHRSTPSLPADPGSLPEESASPARCMIVHQGTILDNVKNLLEFAETLQFIDSDPSWCDLSSFVLSEEEAAFSRSQQHTGKAFQLQQREGHGTIPAGEPSLRVNSPGLNQDTSPGPAKAFSPSRHSMVPLVILRKRRGQASPLSTRDTSSFLFADINSSTPKRSPVKGLPFSPSQVDHNFCTAVTNFQQTPEP
ncbi:myeloblastosis oncogene [Cricetulus griseus]